MTDLRLAGQKGNVGVAVPDNERLAVHEEVPGAGARHLHAQASAAEQDRERDPVEASRQPRREAEGVGLLAHAAEPAHQGDPRPG
jgi:hypothetical protein